VPFDPPSADLPSADKQPFDKLRVTGKGLEQSVFSGQQSAVSSFKVKVPLVVRHPVPKAFGSYRDHHDAYGGKQYPSILLRRTSSVLRQAQDDGEKIKIGGWDK